ncbi:MAG TPA: VOC family protein [Myxococcota bacterium]|nr:VOC family protein [Myxococcota bacterium]
MATTSSVIPEAFHTLTPFLCVADAVRAIEFYKRVFDATVIERHDEPGGKVSHATLRIGDSPLMLSDEFSQHSQEHRGEGWPRSPKSLRGSSASLYMYVANTEAVFERALAEGARVISPVADKEWGDRLGSFEDPFGHIWNVATHVARLPH